MNRRFAIAAVILAIIAVPTLGFVVAAELRADQRAIDTYWQTDGPAYHQIDRAAYNRAVRAGICVTLHAHTWPDHETQHVCDL